MSKRSILLRISSDCADGLDGRLFASIPFDQVVLECLKERVQCFLKAQEAYPSLYETYEFQSLLEWYETGENESYDEQSDRDKLRWLADDAEPGEGESRDESLCAGLDKLGAQEINSLVIPAVKLPSAGNLRTECDQLVMSLQEAAADIVGLRWICYIKHTDVELRTTEISSEDIDRWLAELAEEGTCE